MKSILIIPIHNLFHLFFATGLFSLLALGQLQRITLPLLGASSLYLHDILIVGWILFLVVSMKSQLHLISDSLKKILLPIKIWISVFFMWIIWGWLYQWITVSFSLWPLLYTSRLAAYTTLIILLSIHPTIKKTVTKKILTSMLTGFFLLLLVWGWLQWFLIPDTRWLSIFGWDDHLGRMFGTQFDPNFWGLLLIIGWWWSIFQLKKGSASLSVSRDTIFFSLFSIVSSAALVVTWSRSSYVAFIGSIFFWLMLMATQRTLKHLSKLHISLIVLSCLILISGSLFAPKPAGEGGNITRTSTIDSRVSDTKNAVDTLSAQQLIWGRGLFSLSQSTKIVSNTHFARPNNAKLPSNIPAMLLNGIGVGGVCLLCLGIFLGRKQLLDTFISTLPNSMAINTPVFLAVSIHSLANLSWIQPFIFITTLLVFWAGSQKLAE